jgi:hypothetical protein
MEELTFDELKELKELKDARQLCYERYYKVIEPWLTKLFFKNFLPNMQLSHTLVRGCIYFHINGHEFRIDSFEKSFDISSGNKWVTYYFENNKWCIDKNVHFDDNITDTIYIINYLCKNMDAIETRHQKIYNLLCSTHYIRYLPLVYTFLLCNRHTKSFLKEIAHIIANKILFFSALCAENKNKIEIVQI